MTTKTNTPEVKKEILDLAKELKADAKIENDAVVFEKDVFTKHLPEDVDAKLIKKVENLKQNFALAQSLVTGELACEHMAKNKDVEAVSSSVVLPVGKIVSVVNRNKTIRNVSTGEEVVKHGYVSTRIVTKVPGSGTIAVRNRVQEMAKKAGLGK